MHIIKQQVKTYWFGFLFCFFFNIVELVSNQLSTGHFRCHCLWKLLIILLKGINLINNVGICVFVIAAGLCVILYQVMVCCLIHQIAIESSYQLVVPNVTCEMWLDKLYFISLLSQALGTTEYMNLIT